MRTKILFTFVFSALAVLFTRAGGLDHWQLRNPDRVPYALSSVCYGSNGFVATGDGGTLLTSIDGLKWVDTSYSPSNSVYSVVYAQGRYTASGNLFILSSTNGSNWTFQSSPGAQAFSAMAFGDGTYVGITVFGDIYSSTNGVDWTRQYGLGYPLYSVAFGSGCFVAVGLGGDVVTSTDGTNWNIQHIGSQTLNAVSFGNGRFVTAGEESGVYVSSDGLTWVTNASPAISFERIAFGNGLFIASAVTPYSVVFQ